MTLAELWKQEGKQAGIQEGIEKGRLDVARNMLDEGFDHQTILKMTNLTSQQLATLLK